jgi:glycosyltransferase involved in cell wall biosynthesis
MTKQHKVSVLMPVYNSAEYVAETINSILLQTFTDFEFIIVDDGSTDNSREIIRSYNDERICFYENESNLGIAETRNKLMNLASGEYWAVVDNDDISLPERFAKQVAYLDSHPDVGIVSSWIQYFPDELQVCKSLPRYGLMELLHFKPFLAHPASMLRGNLFRKHNISYQDKYRYAEDYDVWFQALPFMKIDAIQEILLRYRWNGENTTVKQFQAHIASANRVKEDHIGWLTSDENRQKKC